MVQLLVKVFIMKLLDYKEYEEVIVNYDYLVRFFYITQDLNFTFQNDNSNIHCKLESEIKKSTWCSRNKLTSPQRIVTVEKEDKLNSGRDGVAVQITPQVIKVRTRRGEETVITFQYAKAANYPIDLYYVMDLSASMRRHKKRLSELGGQLADVMKNITSNFRLGFGSFVDKTGMPFTNTAPVK